MLATFLSLASSQSYSQQTIEFDALYIEAEIASRNGNDSIALILFQKCTHLAGSNEEHAKAYNRYGAMLFDFNKMDSSVYYLLKACKIDSTLEDVNYNLAVLYHNYLRSDSMAMFYAKKETQYHKNNLMAWILMGELELNKSNDIKALDIADKIIAINPKLDIAHVYKGIVFYRQEKYELSLNEYTKAITNAELYGVISPDNFIRRASAYSKLNRFKQALEDCKRAIIIDSTFVDAYHEKMAVYNDMNDTLGMCHTLLELKKVSQNDIRIPQYEKNLKCH